MKKVFFMVSLLLLSLSLSSTELNVTATTSFYIPNDSDPDIMTGLMITFLQHNNIEAGISFEYFTSKHMSERTVYETSFPFETVSQEFNVETSFIPLLLNMTYDIPIQSRFNPFFRGGIGWAFAEDKISYNHEPDRNLAKNLSYNGFTARVSTGVGYSLLPRLSLAGKMFYNYADMSKQVDLNPQGHVNSGLDMSGLGFALSASYNLF